MIKVFREVWRVLRDDGTAWVNMGDSYGGGSGGNQTNSAKQISNFGTQIEPKKGNMPKQLMGIPWRLAFALQADGWYLRSDIIWSKPNPMPESVTDRPTKAHEYIFMLTKSPRYFFDQEGVREPAMPESYNSKRPMTTGLAIKTEFGYSGIARTTPQGRTCGVHPNGRNIRTVWEWPIGNGGIGKGLTKHSLQDDYFSVIDTEEKAYWIGFLFADAWLGPRSVDLSLSIQDRDHVITFRKAVGSSHKLFEDSIKSRVVVCSKKMADDLRKHGMDAKEKFPEMEDSFIPHFIRGVFDGDGSISNYLPSGRNKYRFMASFLGKENLLKRICYEIGINKTPTFQRGIWRISFSSEADINRVFNYLYADYSVCLERKRLEFPQTKNWNGIKSIWSIATQPFSGAHFATFPEELVRRCLFAGTSERGVCPKCGGQWVRVVRKGDLLPTCDRGQYKYNPLKHDDTGLVMSSSRNDGGHQPGKQYQNITLGWKPSCKCGETRSVSAVVLDPFGGAGTVGVVAQKYNRRAVLLEIKMDYCQMGRKRLMEADVAMI
jgi:DNA modification methylase